MNTDRALFVRIDRFRGDTALLLFNYIGFGFQCSAQPPAKRTAGQIEKETDERPTSNIE
jgi:hypothetical protein